MEQNVLSVLEALGSILSTRGGEKDLMKVGLHPAVEDGRPPRIGHRAPQSSEDAQGNGEEAETLSSGKPLSHCDSTAPCPPKPVVLSSGLASLSC